MSGFSVEDYGALADGLDISDITSDEGNANILRRLKNDDPNFVQLHVRESNLTRREFEYVLEDARSMGVLGHHLGKCTNVTELFMLLPEDLDSDIIEPFLSGLCSNRSIREVSIENSHIPSSDFFRLLVPFVRDNPNLTKFYLQCEMDADQYRSLSSALTEGKSLTHFVIADLSEAGHYCHEESIIANIEALKVHSQLECIVFYRFSMGRDVCTALSDLFQQTAAGMQLVHLSNNRMDDSGVEALVEGLAHCRSLQHLDLADNPSITVRGGRAVASLLEDPNSSLEKLTLRECGIDDESATVFANSLKNNSSLETLFLYSNWESTGEGWKEAFSKALCDTSSVDNTFLSNHTLRYLTASIRGNDHSPDDESHLPYYIRSLLSLNRESDKKIVAVRKILLNHDEFDMQPLFEWDLKVLPLVAGWLERAAAYEIECKVRTEKRTLAAIYQFIRSMPELAIEGILGVNKKSAQKVGGKKRLHCSVSR